MVKILSSTCCEAVQRRISDSLLTFKDMFLTILIDHRLKNVFWSPGLRQFYTLAMHR